MTVYTKKDIVDKLRNGYKERTGEPYLAINFPRDITISMVNDHIMMEFQDKSIKGNMQRNAAAFEPWCLILRYWIKEFNDNKFSVKWNNENELPNDPHYQRFLYRIDKFSELFDFFEIKEQEMSSLDHLKTKRGKIVLNVEGRRDDRAEPSKSTDEMREREIELKIVKNMEIKRRLSELTEIDERTIGNQKPVGVFQDKAKDENSIFPGGAAAIDIWGIGKTDNATALHIFELKKLHGYKKASVGAISELFFYAMIMSDVQKGNFVFDGESEKLLHEIKNTNEIIGHLLIHENNLHPLLSADIINNALNLPKALRFDCILYDDNFTFRKIW